MAFGNGAPDIFSSVSAIMQRDDRKANLAIGALFGMIHNNNYRVIMYVYVCTGFVHLLVVHAYVYMYNVCASRILTKLHLQQK